jgi:hypothetical protein
MAICQEENSKNFLEKFKKNGLTFSGKVIYYNYKVREKEK